MNKRVIQSLMYHVTEFIIQIRPKSHENRKICDKLGPYVHQDDPVLASPMPFSSFREVVVETGHLAFSF